jgi:hypothetical protein
VLRYISGQIFITQIVTLLIYNYMFSLGLKKFDGKINWMVESITFKARTENRFIIKLFIISLFAFIVEMLCFFEMSSQSIDT